MFRHLTFAAVSMGLLAAFVGYAASFAMITQPEVWKLS